MNPWAESHANRAIAVHGFQTLANLVIPLDLTRIIAFDAVREWECSIRVETRCGVPEMGRNGDAAASREKTGPVPEQQQRVCGL
jgi:hypothetical protein